MDLDDVELTNWIGKFQGKGFPGRLDYCKGVCVGTGLGLDPRGGMMMDWSPQCCVPPGSVKKKVKYKKKKRVKKKQVSSEWRWEVRSGWKGRWCGWLRWWAEVGVRWEWYDDAINKGKRKKILRWGGMIDLDPWFGSLPDEEKWKSLWGRGKLKKGRIDCGKNQSPQDQTGHWEGWSMLLWEIKIIGNGGFETGSHHNNGGS